MYRYVSMLRGINVGGHKIIKMPQLKELYESSGLTDVKTYIQSGNVIFRSRRKDPALVRRGIETAIEKSFGFPATVIIRRPSEMGKVIKRNPFAGLPGFEERSLYVAFLSSRPALALVRGLGPLAAKTRDQYMLIGDNVYLYIPSGAAKTLFSNTFFEKNLRVDATSRNWNTVCALFAMSGGKDK